ncbi:MAG: thermonuclease family protein [Methanosarcinales archaeon]
MKKILLLSIFVFISLCITESADIGFVVRVIDGDTIELENGEIIRLIGIDAPEWGEYCYEEATEKLEELIINKNIRLESDVRKFDNYDRSLRYVYLGNMFVNFEMVRSGYAFSWTLEPNTKHSKELENAEIFAKENKLGCLWS